MHFVRNLNSKESPSRILQHKDSTSLTIAIGTSYYQPHHAMLRSGSTAQMNSAVLYLIFNRPKETFESFSVISNAKPKRIYIAADGPRNLDEKKLCEDARSITEAIPWDCEVHRLYRNSNLGCKLAVSQAIDWFFAQEAEGIILEDDVIPNQAFFPFCDLMLHQYREDKQIGCVLGFNQFGQNKISNQYFLSRGFYPWGWATWRDRWNHYSVDVFDIKGIDRSPMRDNYTTSARMAIRLNLLLIRNRLLDTWDYQFLYYLATTEAYSIAPYANLSTNIGVNGAHSHGNKNLFYDYGTLSIESMEIISNLNESEVMSRLLWKEYQEAFPITLLKLLLLRIGMYSWLKRAIKISLNK